MATSLGSSSGTLDVRSGGTTRIVQHVTRAATIPGADGVSRSTAVAARNAILDLVAGFTVVDMYRLP
jgi:hypothetical protein